MKYTKFFAALVLSIAAAVPAIAQVPLVYTSQPRDVTPLTGAKMSGQPIQVENLRLYGQSPYLCSTVSHSIPRC